MTRPGLVLSRHRRLGVLAICSLSLFVVGLDITIVNVALPSIQHAFHARFAGLQWVVNAYSVVAASLVVLWGSTGDRVGRRRVLQAGLVLFVAGSALCSLAASIELLVLFRVIQALGGSMLTPNSLAIIRNVFTDGRERARAIGMWGAVFGISAASGPLLGGLLIEAVGWRGVFWVNIPIGAIGFLLAARFVPESRDPSPRRIDVPGQVLFVVFLAALSYAIIEAPAREPGSPVIAAAAVVAVVAFGSFIGLEAVRSDPLLDLRFFRSAPFSGAQGVAILAFMVLAGFLFLNTLYLQGVRGDSALVAGASTLPMMIPFAVTAVGSGRILSRYGPRLPLLLTGVLIAASMGILTQLTPSLSYGTLALAYVLLGAGLGLASPAITTTAMSGMPAAKAGLASAIASSSRQVGMALGVAVSGSVVSARFHASIASQAARLPGSLRAELLRSIFATSTRVGWWAGLGCGLAITVLGWLMTTSQARVSARRAAESLGAEADAGGPPQQ